MGTDGVKSEYVSYTPYTCMISLLSSLVSTASQDDYKTLQTVGQKALDEVNYRLRDKYAMSSRLSALLSSVKAPEASYENYSLKDLFTKLLRNVGAIPVVGDTDRLDSGEDPLLTISYVKPGEDLVSYNFENGDYEDIERSSTTEEYSDCISSRLTNLISEDDAHSETSIFGAATFDYTQITEDNAGFAFSYPIYWTKSVKLYGFSINCTYTYNGSSITGPVYGNQTDYAPSDTAHQYWDLSGRCFENDIYKSLPDVNAQTATGRIDGYLSQGNTISYTSGENFISNCGHLAPSVPDYDAFCASTSVVANLSLIEAVYILAIQAYGGTSGTDITLNDDGTLDIKNLYGTTLTVVSQSLDEFVYRGYSPDDRKTGAQVENRVNAQDKVLSFADVVSYLSNERDRQGNIISTPEFHYANIADCIKTGVRVLNDYVLTSRTLQIYGRYVGCTYEFTKHFVLQSSDIRLNNEYERYSVPYDYVRREVLQFEHVILSTDQTALQTRYGTDNGAVDVQNAGCGSKAFGLFCDYVVGQTEAPEEAFGRINITYPLTSAGSVIQTARSFVVKSHKISGDSSISYIGRFVDNYSAGNQVYASGDYRYSEPYRYVDSLGRTRLLSFEFYSGADISNRKFPENIATNTFSDALALTTASASYFTPGNGKDAREGYEFNLTGSLEAESGSGVYVYSCRKGINRISVAYDDPDSINERTTLADLHFNATETVNDEYRVEATDCGSGVREYDVYLPQAVFDDVGNNPVVLWYSGTDVNSILKIIITGYSYEAVDEVHGAMTSHLYKVKFYASASLWGKRRLL